MLAAQEQLLALEGSTVYWRGDQLGSMTLDSFYLEIPGSIHVNFQCDLLIRDCMNLRHAQGVGERLGDSQRVESIYTI